MKHFVCLSSGRFLEMELKGYEYLFFFLRFLMYLLGREREKAQAGVVIEGEGESGSPLSSEPDVGS